MGVIPGGEDGDVDLGDFDGGGLDGFDSPVTLSADYTTGVFTVGESGDVKVDFLYDGGFYSNGEVGIFSLEGMDEFEIGSQDYIQEAARRALSGSELGHVVISDATEGAKFSGHMGEGNFNAGEYQEPNTVKMRSGDKFGIMLAANHSMEEVSEGKTWSVRFSMATANPDDDLQFGQVADVTGDGNTFAFEDLSVDSSDRDYNDIVFQIHGAEGEAALMDEMVAEGADWRDTETGWEILEYVRSSQETDDVTVDDGITDDTTVITDDTVTVETPDTEIVDDVVVDDTDTDTNDVDDPDVVVDDTSDDTDEVDVSDPISQGDIVRDDWATQKEDVPAQDDSHIGDTVDEKDVVNPWDQQRTFDDDYDWEEDGFGNSSSTNYAPTVTGYDQSVYSGQSRTPFFRVSDANGDSIQRYYFYDSDTSSTSGYFTLNGVKQNSSFFVDAASLGAVQYVGGSQAGTESVRVYAYDGKSWGSDDFRMTTRAAINYAPVVSLYNQTVSTGLSMTPSIRVSDANGDHIQRYYFRDYNTNSTSGYFTVNGVKQSSGFSVDADKLNTVRFVGGSQSGTDSVRIYAYDGKTWGSQTTTYTTRLANRAPTITAYDYTINSGSSIYPYIRVSDADGDRIQRYYFYDSNSSSTSGYFTVNGVKQSSGFYVDADRLNTVRFVGGSQAGTDSVRIYAYDGKAWGSKNVTYTTRVPNRAPTITATAHTVNSGVSILPSIRVSDADGDRIQRYYIRDYNSSSTSGYFTVNGVKQSGGFYVNADQFSTVRFVGGSQIGTDSVRIYAYDGKTWGSTTTTYTTVVANRAPTVTAYDQQVRSGSNVSPFFRVSDADGDRIQRYYFYDSNNNSTSGYYTVNGVKQSYGFYVDADKLSTVKYVGGSQAGKESLRVYAYDGKTWGSDTYTVETLRSNQAPVVTASNQKVTANSSIVPFFRVSDPDGDRIQRYYFSDYNQTSTSGYFTVNGVRQTSGFSVSADKLNTVRFVGGSQAGTDSVRIWAYDGQTWGNSERFDIETERVNRAPIVTSVNQTVKAGSIVTPYFRVSDPDGDRIQRYYFRDYNTSSTSGYFTVNGVKQNSGFSITADQLNSIKFVGGSQASIDKVGIWAYDGQTWGHKAINMTTQKVNTAPVVNLNNQTVNRGQSITPQFSVTDLDGDKMTRYGFYDENSSSSSGYFTINGVKQAAGKVFYVDADKLNTVKFVGGSAKGSDKIHINASDGQSWSGWKNANITTQGGSAPVVVSATSQTISNGQVIKPTFTITDADSDAITQYAFKDWNAKNSSGYFTVNGVKQEAGNTFYVDADKLDTVRFVGGDASGADSLSVSVRDSSGEWSTVKNFSMTTKVVEQNDWFTQNIKDTVIREVARSRFQDGVLDRKDMIDIFNNAKDGLTVDSNEFSDLKALVNNTSLFKDDYVQVLSSKVVNGNAANAKFQGQTLGNLYAGTDDKHLDKLIQEHFFGKDRPSVIGDFTYANGSKILMTYREVNGQLFQNGVSYQDVKQGVAGDCYYLAGLAATALKTPNAIEKMFVDNGDDTYTVRLFKSNGEPDYVTVDRYLPTETSQGWLPFAKVNGYGDTYKEADNELWVALAEKAYAQVNEAGSIGRDGTNSYEGIESGSKHNAVAHITAESGKREDSLPSSAQEIINAFNNGTKIGLSSNSKPILSNLVGSHAYVMVGFNSLTQKFKLFNPWGIGNKTDDGHVELSWAQIQQNYRAWTYNM
ncbi:C2 family cysteine protease [Spirulina subsalsa CS-330]|nr:C2 family cysteine protease [Spirulina subsalsa CS-330]